MLRRMFLSAAVALPLAATLAVAQPPPHHRHGMEPGHRLEKAIQQLGLDPDQMTKVQGILDAGKAAREKKHQDLRIAFDEMHTLLEQDSPDETAVLAQADKIGAIETEGHKAMLHTLLAVRAELTPDQRQKLKELKEQHGKGGWHHGHKPPPDEPEAD